MERYGRQLQSAAWGPAAQMHLKASLAVVLGLTSLTEVAAGNLITAGLGRLRLVELQRVALADLGFLFREADLRKPKVKIAEQRLQELNPFTAFEPLERKITPKNLGQLISGADLVLTHADANLPWDDWQPVIWQKKVPWLLGWLTDTKGYLTLLCPGATPCLTCSGLVAKMTKASTFLAPWAAVLGALMAYEAMHLLGRGKTLSQGRLLTLDGARGLVELKPLTRSAGVCPRCGTEGANRSLG